MKYQIRKPTVGDMRAIYDHTDDPKQISFLLAERCILIDGNPIGREGLDNMPLEEFEDLVDEIVPQKKSLTG